MGSSMVPHLGVEMVSPEKVTYEGTAEMVVVRTLEGGDIAFQPGHASFLGVLDVWSVEVVRSEHERDVFAVHRGFVQMHDNTVTVLSDVSEAAGDIDIARAEKARDNAMNELASDDSTNVDAASALKRADLRLRVAQSASPSAVQSDVQPATKPVASASTTAPNMTSTTKSVT